jgi:hypothetical protein
VIKASESSRKLIARALPKHQLMVKRETLIDAVAERIETWQKLEPHVGPHAEKVRRMVAIADEMKHAMERARAELCKLGADQSDVIDPVTGERVIRHSVGRALYLICGQALNGVERWDHFNRPGRGPRPAFSAALTAALRDLCRQAGCSTYEVDEFLRALNDSRKLPKLTTATLKKRDHRAKKKTRTI